MLYYVEGIEINIPREPGIYVLGDKNDIGKSYLREFLQKASKYAYSVCFVNSLNSHLIPADVIYIEDYEILRSGSIDTYIRMAKTKVVIIDAHKVPFENAIPAFVRVTQRHLELVRLPQV